MVAGKGGSVIDLAMGIYQVGIKEAVSRLKQLTPFDRSGQKNEPIDFKNFKKHIVVTTKPLGYNMAISSYLQERCIFDEAVRCGKIQEVYYDYFNDEGRKKRYFGAGWQNISGGYDVRSKYGKVCIDNKDILIVGNGETTNVFEGMLNFLSAMKEGQATLQDMNLILNSVTLSRRGIETLREKKLDGINLFFDNDQGGDRCTIAFQKAFPNAIDKRELYLAFSDYNEKVMNEEIALKKTSVGK